MKKFDRTVDFLLKVSLEVKATYLFYLLMIDLFKLCIMWLEMEMDLLKI